MDHRLGALHLLLCLRAELSAHVYPRFEENFSPWIGPLFYEMYWNPSVGKGP